MTEHHTLDGGDEHELGDAAPAARPQPLVDARRLARHLSVSPTTLRRMVGAGAVPFVMVGDRKRFDVAEVVAALKRQTGRK